VLVISEKAKISPLADIEDSVRGSRIVIEDGAVIDAFVKIKPAGGSGDVRVGAGTTLNSGCVIYTGHGVDIGARCAIAANVIFAGTNHEFRDPDRDIVDQGFMPGRGGIIVEDGVWIGAGVVLLDGAILRKGCVVGALSLVRSEIPAGAVCTGNPAAVIGQRGRGRFALPETGALPAVESV